MTTASSLAAGNPATEPIAIVGHACVLPGALDPGQLWAGVLAGRSAVTPVPEHRWRLSGAEDPLSAQGVPGPRVGGYVHGFDTDPGDTGLAGADPLLHWLLYVLRESLREAGRGGPQPRAGLVLGTLAYPTRSAALLAEDRLLAPLRGRLGLPEPVPGDQRNRRFATLPARLAAAELELGGGGFALDSACASGLVAVKLAADRLRDGSADLMLAAAVNRADNLLVHNAFHALSALSASGASRPLDRSADGLVPAEGAAAVALMRLSDALLQDVPVLGVVRGVGLSNDGRTGGLLAPGEQGQLRAMRAAYAEAGVAPESVSLLECHATGTPVGDLVEVRSSARLFADAADLPVGSVKSNLGHPLAVGGLAGLVKVLGALRTGIRPPTAGLSDPLDALRGTPLRPLFEPEDWTGERRAAVSAFGFGGANAHLVVDAFPASGSRPRRAVPAAPPAPVPLAVVGGAVCAGDRAEFAAAGLALPPADLARATATGLRVLAAARVAVQDVELPRERTMVVVGAAEDEEVARYGLRWRLPGRLGADLPAGGTDEVREACAPPFDLAAVLGTMPNLLAHRVNTQGDLGGQGLVVFDAEDSGRLALGLAARALRAGEADAAVVGDAVTGAVVVLRRAADAADHPDAVPLPEDGDLARVAAVLEQRRAAAGGLDRVAVRVFTGADRDAVATAADRPEPADAGAGPGPGPGSGPARLVLVGADPAAARAWLAGSGPRPDGVAYRDAPLGGELAFVFTNGSAAYPGMGHELARALPALGEAPPPAADVLDQIHGVSALAGAHVRLTRGLLGLRPTAAIGYSSGEVSALAALGVWPELSRLVDRSRTGGLFRDGITREHRVLAEAWGGPGGWAAHVVLADAEQVRACLEPRAHLMARNAPGVSVIGGDPAACARVLARLDAASLPLEYDVAAHVPELEPVRAQLADLHRLPTVPVPGIRFYRGATGEHYTEPDAETAAQAVAEQAVSSLDWVRTVESAWADGVRVFVEHGPQGLCTAWTGRILEGRPHLAVALDAERNALGQLRTAVAELLAAGVELDHAAVFGGAGPVLRLPLTREPLRLPETRPRPELMARAPGLPRITPADPLPPAVRIPAPVPATATAASGPRSLPSVVAAHHQAVAAAHRSFLELQADTHRRFLAGRTRALTSLLTGRPPRPGTAPAPAPDARWSRADLERLASGRVSDLFGPAFAALDGRTRQTRMPMPPMLLADRVTRIEGEPGSMGTGSIQTETDVAADAWYLDPAGRMAAGPFVEAGQADLLLISWLGVDLANPQDRVYRLLGCRVTFHGELPAPGERLRYDISIDRHVEHQGVRLFFFRYACYVGDRLRLTLTEGQAGHFTDAELAGSGGIHWTPESDPPPPARVDPPAVRTERRSFDARALRAFTEGRAADCFGPGWEPAKAHRSTPRPGGGELRLLHEITAFDPHGGPWGRGYLCARAAVRPDDWFFGGHFLNDPCMPGTLMLEAALQALAFHLAALGHTVDRDGWRFEPVQGVDFDLRCRGQVTPDTRSLEYRVFVTEVHAGPEPTVHAQVLCVADGLPAFHVRRAAVRLVPPRPATGQSAHSRGDSR